ncbi:MAG: diguanylate cyclase domain-containing protein [Alcanivorax nanhaiticus]
MTAATPQSRADSHNQQAIERALSLCLRHRHPVTLLAIAIAEKDSLQADIGEDRMETLIALLAEQLHHDKRCEDLLISNPDDHLMVVVLPATDMRGGHRLAERLLARIAHQAFRLDEFEVDVRVRIALHGCETLEHTDAQPLIDATLAMLQHSGNAEPLLLSKEAQQALSLPAVPAGDSLASDLVTRVRRQGEQSLLNTLKPALSRLPESERMKLVDHLLDLSTQMESGLVRH